MLNLGLHFTARGPDYSVHDTCMYLCVPGILGTACAGPVLLCTRSIAEKLLWRLLMVGTASSDLAAQVLWRHFMDVMGFLSQQHFGCLCDRV